MLLLLLLMMMMMLWNNLTSLHTAAKTISSSILTGTEKKKFYPDKHIYRYIYISRYIIHVYRQIVDFTTLSFQLMYIKKDTDSEKMRITSLSSLLSTVGCCIVVLTRRDSQTDGWMDALFVWVRTYYSILYHSILYPHETLLVYILENTQTSSRFHKRCCLTARLNEIDNGTHGTQCVTGSQIAE